MKTRTISKPRRRIFAEDVVEILPRGMWKGLLMQSIEGSQVVGRLSPKAANTNHFKRPHLAWKYQPSHEP